MLRTEAARYARWSAAVALLLAGATFGVYLHRDWRGHVEREKAPPPAPLDVSRQSAGITFKKRDQTRTIFIVEASKSTEFKGEDASILEDVTITIFGNTGDRHDVIHTKTCRYEAKSGSIACSGDVQIDLLSAQDAERTKNDPTEQKARTMHVETRAVRFDRASGEAQTDQPVTFVFPNGSGNATGLEYNSDAGRVRLLHDVRLTLVQAPQPTAARRADSARKSPSEAQQIHVTGARLDFGRDNRLIVLHGPAAADSGAERLTAGEISLFLDENFRAETLMAEPGRATNKPLLMSKGTDGERRLEADTLTAHFSPEGWVTSAKAKGNIHASRESADVHDEATADTGALDLWPRVSQPKELNLDGKVTLKTVSSKSSDTKTLRSNWVRMTFSGGEEGEDSSLRKAETLAPGVLEWTDSSAQSDGAPSRTKLQADRLAMDFGPQAKARQLLATGNVETERFVPGRPLQTATARNGVAEMLPTGGWSEMELRGNAKLTEAERQGQADRINFEHAAQTAILTGHATARDATTQTWAQRITFAQDTGDIHAEGGVRSTDFAPRGAAVQLATAPANITSDSLQANSNAGRALYAGHARLWQGDSVLEANSIELLRATHVLNASGNVRAVFPQAPAQTKQADTQGSARAAQQAASRISGNVAPVSARKIQLWHASSGTLKYFDLEGRAHLEHNVIVQSADQRMRAPVLDIYFTRIPSENENSASTADAAGGSRQITRAVGTGGVVVEEGDRRAVAERGEYTAADGKFLMTGGKPTLYDGSEGATTGRQLTFFLADDTIIVDSENGSRTLTKHRVQR